MSRVLSSFEAPFSYITNSSVEDEFFERGMKHFLGVVSVVKAFKKMRIGQIGPRAGSYWSLICNAGELLERFGVDTIAITLVKLAKETKNIIGRKDIILEETVKDIQGAVRYSKIGEDAVVKLVALKIAIKNWASAEWVVGRGDSVLDRFAGYIGSHAVFSQCRTHRRRISGGMRNRYSWSNYIYNSIIFKNAEIGCFFANITIRHAYIDIEELFWHFRNFPHSLMKEKAKPYLDNHDILPENCLGVEQ
jgi:hypothetical protein